MVQAVNLREDPVVAVRGLTVRYGDDTALSDLSFTIDRGRVLAVVGANGAGKSTLFRAMLGFLPCERGSVTLFGCEPHALEGAERAHIAYVSERHPELAHARVDEVARFRASVYPRFDGALFGALAAELDLPLRGVIGELSRGQRAGAVVSLALAQRPDLLLLDDPTLGLDPLARRRILQAVLAATRDRAITVLIATHELADVERVADDLVLLARGHGAIAIDIERFVADASACKVPDTVDRASIARIDGVLHVWQRRGEQEVVIRGDAQKRARTERLVAELAQTPDVGRRGVGFEELALAWLARVSADRMGA
jgi:ABC-type multidrug transport system ATPase subunit